MRCTFCATGKGGFARNLKAHEIVDQVLTVQEAFGTRVSNVGKLGVNSLHQAAHACQGLHAVSQPVSVWVPAGVLIHHHVSADPCPDAWLLTFPACLPAVFMGMGEPLLNWRVVLQALEFLNKDIGIGARHMTVSTVGIPNAIAKLAAHGLQATLAVSIHAPTQELRERLVPSAKVYPLEALMQDSREYFKVSGSSGDVPVQGLSAFLLWAAASVQQSST